MPNSYVSTRPRTELVPAKGHVYWFTRPVPFEKSIGRATLGQGGIVASAEDLANYALSYIRTDPDNTKSGLAAMMAPYEDAPGIQYGLGWFIRDYPDYRLVWHGGQSPGFECVVAFSPDAKFGYVLLVNTNSSFGSVDVASLTFGVGHLVMNLPPPSKAPFLIARIILVAVYLVPLFLAFQIFGFVRKVNGGRLKPLRSSKNSIVSSLRLIMPSMFLTGLGYVLLIFLPKMNGAPMSAVSLFTPDVALILKVGGILALMWALVLPLLRVRCQQVHSSEFPAGPQE
jgi:hypothetical protein